MKHSFLSRGLLLPTLLAMTTVTAVGQASGAREPVRPLSQCMDAANINEWHVIDDTTMTVRNGPRRYVITTTHTCPALGRYGDGLHFHPSRDKAGLDPWRICGDLGETVSSRQQPPCAVKSVRRIDKQAFDTLNKRAERNGSGADQPTVLPSRKP